MPRVSVLMPVYNTGKYVAEAAKSILNQTLGDFEFVIVDDGSTDDSREVLKELAARDRRIRLIARENRGLVETRNELLHEAKAELIAWADSDDRYAKERLERQWRRFEAQPDLVVLGTSWQMIDSAGLPIKRFSFPESHEDVCRLMSQVANGMWFPTVMMKRRPAIAVGGFRHPFILSEDYDLHLRMSEVGRVGNLPDLLCFYRQHFSSTVSSRHWQAPGYAELARTLAEERRRSGTDRLQRGEKVELRFDAPMTDKEVVEHLRLKWAWWALNEGYLETARKHAAMNMVEKPFKRESWKLLYCAIRGW